MISLIPPVSQDNITHKISSCDLHYSSWESSHNDEFCRQDHSDTVAGEFVRMGFDYIGEPNGNAPAQSNYFGSIEFTSFPYHHTIISIDGYKLFFIAAYFQSRYSILFPKKLLLYSQEATILFVSDINCQSPIKY